jgi:hypothetical protein
MLGIVVVLSHGRPCPCPLLLLGHSPPLSKVAGRAGESWRERLAVGDLDHLASALARDAHAVVLARGNLCVAGLAVCWW